MSVLAILSMRVTNHFFALVLSTTFENLIARRSDRTHGISVDVKDWVTGSRSTEELARDAQTASGLAVDSASTRIMATPAMRKEWAALAKFSEYTEGHPSCTDLFRSCTDDPSSKHYESCLTQTDACVAEVQPFITSESPFVTLTATKSHLVTLVGVETANKLIKERAEVIAGALRLGKADAVVALAKIADKAHHCEEPEDMLAVEPHMFFLMGKEWLEAMPLRNAILLHGGPCMDAPSEVEAEAKRLGNEIAEVDAHPAVAVSLADELDMLVPGRAVEIIARKARNTRNPEILSTVCQCGTKNPTCTKAELSNDKRGLCKDPDLMTALKALIPVWPITKLPDHEGLLTFLYGTNAVETQKKTSHRAP